MFTIKDPDTATLALAHEINDAAQAMLSFMTSSTVNAFRALFYDGETVRPKAEIRAILAQFDTPAELFQRHAAATAFILSQVPGSMVEADYVVPVDYTLHEDGSVTIPD